MKEELEKLGFERIELYGSFKYQLNINNLKIIEVLNSGSVYISDDRFSVFLFLYNHEKLKQLIKLLS